MMKKAAAQGVAKELYTKLLDRLTKNIEEADKLMAQTNLPSYTAVPDHNVLQNLLAECEDSDFW